MNMILIKHFLIQSDKEEYVCYMHVELNGNLQEQCLINYNLHLKPTSLVNKGDNVHFPRQTASKGKVRRNKIF